MISANDENGIQRNAMLLKDYIDSSFKTQSSLSEAQFMKDLMYTLNEKRSRLKWRASVIASSMTELCQQLTGGILPKFRAANIELGISFVFTGQGAQWPGMGKMLMEFPVFRQSVEAASLYLQKQGSQWTLHGKDYDPANQCSLCSQLTFHDKTPLIQYWTWKTISTIQFNLKQLVPYCK